MTNHLQNLALEAVKLSLTGQKDSLSHLSIQ